MVFNIRFLLHDLKIPPDAWAKELSRRTRTGISPERADEIIQGRGRAIEFRELEIIADAFTRDTEELIQGQIYSDGPESLRRENIAFLLNTLPYGGRKALALALGIQQATITRWVSENKVPEGKNVEGLLKFLGLDSKIDLTSEPLFLSVQPLGGFQQRHWLIERLKAMPEKEITRLFPALERIMRKDETN